MFCTFEFRIYETSDFSRGEILLFPCAWEKSIINDVCSINDSMNIPYSLFLATADICGIPPRQRTQRKKRRHNFLNRWNLSSTLEMWLISVCLSFSSSSDNLCSRSYFDLLSHNFYQLSRESFPKHISAVVHMQVLPINQEAVCKRKI